MLTLEQLRGWNMKRFLYVWMVAGTATVVALAVKVYLLQRALEDLLTSVRF